MQIARRVTLTELCSPNIERGVEMLIIPFGGRTPMDWGTTLKVHNAMHTALVQLDAKAEVCIELLQPNLLPLASALIRQVCKQGSWRQNGCMISTSCHTLLLTMKNSYAKDLPKKVAILNCTPYSEYIQVLGKSGATDIVIRYSDMCADMESGYNLMQEFARLGLSVWIDDVRNSDERARAQEYGAQVCIS